MVTEPPTDRVAAPIDAAATPVLRKRLVWIPVGLLCVGLGGIGLVLPGLPSTIFFIAAAAAFSKSSPRLEAWVLELRGVGPLIRDYRAGVGMPRRAKVIAITMMWTAIVLSGLATGLVAVALGLAVLGIAGTVTILRVRTRQP